MINNIKKIRDDLYGPRNMFLDPNVLQIDRARKGMAPEYLEHPDWQFHRRLFGYPDLEIAIPDEEPDLVELLLRKALSNVGV